MELLYKQVSQQILKNMVIYLFIFIVGDCLLFCYGSPITWTARRFTADTLKNTIFASMGDFY